MEILAIIAFIIAAIIEQYLELAPLAQQKGDS